MTEQSYDEFEEETPPKQRRVRPMALILALVVLATLFAAVAWFSISNDGSLGGRQIAAFEPPVLKANPEPYKRKPDDPGGMQIPNQDKLVYERILPEPAPQKTEHLLPKPEEPMPRPKPEEPPAPVQPAAKPEQAQTEPPAASAEAEQDTSPLPPPAVTASDNPASEPEKEAMVDKSAPPTGAAEEAETVEKVADAAVRISEDGTPIPIEKPVQLAAIPPAASVSQPEALAATGSSDLKRSFRLQLAAFRDEEQAMISWQRLRKKYPAELAALEPMLERVEIAGKGVFHRLQVGPYADATAAGTACTALKAQKQDCLIVKPN